MGNEVAIPSRLLSAARALAVAASFLGAPWIAYAQPACRVLDPELQGPYEGGCIDGKAEGKGTAKGSATYSGEFHQGMKHGRGVKTWAWGDRYEGEFAEDYKEGWGIYTWGARTLFAGDRYEGGFARDKRNGYGVYIWASGDSYAGPWKDDALAGQATPMMIAKYRATQAAIAALGKPGIKVCHESILGTARSVWVEGETRALNPDARQVSIRVTKLGEATLVVAGKQVPKGEVVWDDPLNWVPCN
jgi:hypothetical protein